eukprot:1158081-Pelagomonas_calceolata.AAC.2
MMRGFNFPIICTPAAYYSVTSSWAPEPLSRINGMCRGPWACETGKGELHVSLSTKVQSMRQGAVNYKLRPIHAWNQELLQFCPGGIGLSASEHPIGS